MSESSFDFQHSKRFLHQNHCSPEELQPYPAPTYSRMLRDSCRNHRSKSRVILSSPSRLVVDGSNLYQEFPGIAGHGHEMPSGSTIYWINGHRVRRNDATIADGGRLSSRQLRHFNMYVLAPILNSGSGESREEKPVPRAFKELALMQAPEMTPELSLGFRALPLEQY